MPETFFTSDTHFGHGNVIAHSARPFASLEVHDADLIAAWNGVVGEKDTVYHLGDFAWRDALQYRDQLKGNIALIIGNHEAAAEKIKHRFIWVKDVHMVRLGDLRVWCSHYAHRVWPKSHHGAWHLYGHSHGSLADDPHARSMDVGIDAAARLVGAYRPLALDEVRAVIEKKEWHPVDHHVGRGVGA